MTERNSFSRVEAMSVEELRDELLHLISQINRLHQQVDNIVGKFFNKPHFYNVADIDCEESDFGLCVYDLPIVGEEGLTDEPTCLYCNKKIYK